MDQSFWIQFKVMWKSHSFWIGVCILWGKLLIPLLAVLHINQRGLLESLTGLLELLNFSLFLAPTRPSAGCLSEPLSAAVVYYKYFKIIAIWHRASTE